MVIGVHKAKVVALIESLGTGAQEPVGYINQSYQIHSTQFSSW